MMSNKITYNFEDDDFVFEIPDDAFADIRKAILDNISRDELIDMINDLIDDDAFLEYHYDTICDSFYDTAQEQYFDYVASQDPYDYYMIRRTDIDGI